MEVLLNSLKDYLLQPFILVGAPNFGPAAAAPAGPAPTALSLQSNESHRSQHMCMQACLCGVDV